jgi:deferrochelatase/peroxidase EfeB
MPAPESPNVVGSVGALPSPPVALQRPMTLVMPLADPSYAGIQSLMQNVFLAPGVALGTALDDGGTVHFARFVVIENSLVMASSYDGDFADYIQMFIHTIGDVFELLMGYVVDPPPLPVQQHPDAFVDWVQAHDIASIGFYSAYPEVSAVQIRQAFNLLNEPPPPKEPAPPPLPADQLTDIQGLILRGLGHTMVRHLVMKVNDAPSARAALGEMATDGTPGPKVTHGARWEKKPPSCLIAGLTATGLVALGLPDASVQSFPTDFLEGAVARAAKVGDWDYNAPEEWGALSDPDQVHVLLSVYASSANEMETACAEVTTFLSGCTETTSFDGAVFPDHPNKVHFGYRDNISQPIINGDPVVAPPDGPQALAPPGEFLLGYESQYGGVTLDVPQPSVLGVNGSFTAFRVLQQDVAGYETFIESVAAKATLDKELVAAKVVGRWRNGVALVEAPGPTMPPDPPPGTDLNNYGYQVTDPAGLRCPVGAHMRRGNPRDQTMLPLGDGGRRRIMRRGIPYGPEWHAGDPPDQVARGLLGHFIGASLTLQFETVMGEWLNRGLTNPDITDTNDVLIGVAQDPNTFTVPLVPNAPPLEVPVSNMQFTFTKGCVYAFLPSRSALRWIGALPS